MQTFIFSIIYVSDLDLQTRVNMQMVLLTFLMTNFDKLELYRHKTVTYHIPQRITVVHVVLIILFVYSFFLLHFPEK